MIKENKNYGKSVKAKLLNLSKAEEMSYQFLYTLLYDNTIDDVLLEKAIHATLKNRGTAHEESHPLFTDDFSMNPRFQMLWKNFMKKIKKAEPDFETVIHLIKEKLFPIWKKYENG